MANMLKHFTNTPVAVALAFLLIGAPTAPVTKMLPSFGTALAFGGCGDTFHGCGRGRDGRPCGRPNGITCIFDYEYSLYDINNMNDLILAHAAAVEARGVRVAFKDKKGADCSAQATGLILGGGLTAMTGSVLASRTRPPLNITVTQPLNLMYYDPAGVGIVPLSADNDDEGAGGKSVLDAIGFGLLVVGLVTTATGVTLHYVCGDGASDDDDDDEEAEED